MLRKITTFPFLNIINQRILHTKPFKIINIKKFSTQNNSNFENKSKTAQESSLNRSFESQAPVDDTKDFEAQSRLAK